MGHVDPWSEESNNTVLADVDPEVTASMLAPYTELGRITDPTWLHAIHNATHYRFKAHTTLERGASPLNKFLLILKGNVRVYYPAHDGREITLYRMQPGELSILNMNNVFQNHCFERLFGKRHFDAIAQSDTDGYALGISAPDFQSVLAASEAFRSYVFAIMNGRLCELMCLVQDIAFQNLSTRLACLLGRLFERAQSNTIQVTHQELAQEIGTTREVVSRILKEFKHHDYVRLARGQIVLSDASSFPGRGRNQ